MIFKHYALGEPNSQIFCQQRVIFLENKFTSHLQSQAHAPVNACIVHAKPRIRSHGAGMAQGPGRALKGVLHTFFQSLFQCCAFSQKMPLIPLGMHQAFPGAVVPSLLHLKPSGAESTFPGRCWPPALSVPFTPCSDLEQVEKKLLQSVDVFYHSQVLGSVFPSALQRLKFSFSFWIFFFMEGQGGLFAPLLMLRKDFKTFTA